MTPQHYIFIAIAIVLLLVLYSRISGGIVKSEDMDEVNMPDDDDAPARIIKN